MNTPGKVYLVGAGPGDPDLLTVKALRLIQSADVVVHDRLISTEILGLVPSDVTRISVGKASGHHSLPQEQINELIANLAKRGRNVVRLKGGDPFIFGRGSEEALYLRERGIEFEIIPGITAALAVSAYTGVPLTHRGMSRGVRLVTGHLRDDETLELDWRALADPAATLVVYMGLTSLSLLRDQLVAAGLAPKTPAMAVQDGTTRRQRRVIATLDKLPARVEAAKLQPPVLLIVGQTVALAGQLDWFSPGADLSVHARPGKRTA